jgi:hypothetical protein
LLRLSVKVSVIGWSAAEEGEDTGRSVWSATAGTTELGIGTIGCAAGIVAEAGKAAATVAMTREPAAMSVVNRFISISIPSLPTLGPPPGSKKPRP